jgi:hypothetical protein
VRARRRTVAHPFGTIRATHCLMKRPPKVAIEMALHGLADNLTRELNTFGVSMMATVR